MQSMSSSQSDGNITSDGPEAMAASNSKGQAQSHERAMQGLQRRLKGTEGGQFFRPSLLQQLIRATIHMVTFGVAYIIMLLAMYYNGYFIICILIGAFLGSFIFSWERSDTS